MNATLAATGQPVAHHDARRVLTRSTVLSVALHVGLIGALLWAFRPPAVPEQSDRLVVELYGMIAERQTEERKAAEATPPTPAEPRPQPRALQEKPKPQVVQKKTQRQPMESPVQVQEEQVEAPSLPQPVPDASQMVSDTQQQQRLNVQDDNLNAFKQYLGRLKKQIQAHLVYPDEVKKSGVEGNAVIRFVLTPAGIIKSGSLQIARSSGNAGLDASALKAARDSEPFEPPPREMEVAIGVSFSQQR